MSRASLISLTRASGIQLALLEIHETPRLRFQSLKNRSQFLSRCRGMSHRTATKGHMTPLFFWGGCSRPFHFPASEAGRADSDVITTAE